ncbi:MAG: hypothetical protein WA940_13680 [Sphingopyxis sp.]
MNGRWIALAVAAAAPAGAAAQTDDPPDATALKALEAGVPPQSWYPDGYYDLRIAAEAEAAENPRAAERLVTAMPDAAGKLRPRYDIVDCAPDHAAADSGDAATRRLGDLALEVARLRHEFARLTYPTAVYAEPLLAFERAGIKATDAGDYSTLAAAAEANRQRIAPTLPAIAARASCSAEKGAGPILTRGIAAALPAPRPSVTLATQPATGEVLLISAFAFKVCTRKQPDPWDRFQCKWNEIETGVKKPLSGRFVYQVKWPDGTVRKGTREIVPGPAATVTFKKTGS